MREVAILAKERSLQAKIPTAATGSEPQQGLLSHNNSTMAGGIGGLATLEMPAQPAKAPFVPTISV